MGLECEVHHASVGQAKSDARNFDLVLVSEVFAKEFANAGNCKVVGLLNLLSEEEIRTKVDAALK